MTSTRWHPLRRRLRAPSLAPLVAALVLAAACGGPQTETEVLMANWAQALKYHLGTGFDTNFEFPRRLMEIDPALRVDLGTVDGWGTDLHYRRWRDDRYDLISAGPDGAFGNEDDLVMVNGVQKKPMEIYAERPFKKKRRR